MAEGKKQIIEFHQHVDYREVKKLWQDLKTLIDADKAKLSNSEFLFYHPSEIADNFIDSREKALANTDRQRRVEATQYKNLIKFVRDRFVELIMKGGINTQDLTDHVSADELNDIDLKKHSLNDFASGMAEDLITYGINYVLTDATEEGEIRNLQDQQQSKLRPFFTKLDPLAVHDWQLTKRGAFQFLTLEYKKLIPRKKATEAPVLGRYKSEFEILSVPLTNNTKKDTYSVSTYFSADDKDLEINYLNTANGHDPFRDHKNWVLTTTDIIDSKLDHIPIASNLLQESWLKDIKPIALKIYNKESNLDNILYQQGYDKLFLFADLSSQTGENGDKMKDSAKQISISVNTVTVINDFQGSVVKIPPTNPEALFKSIAVDRMDLFSIAFSLIRTISAESKEAEGADALRESKEALFTKIEGKRKEIIDILNEAFKNYIFFKDTTKKIPPIALKFNRSLNELDFQNFITLVTAFASRLLKYPTLQREVDKMIVGKLELNDNQNIIKEMDSLQDDKVVETEADKLAKQSANILTR